jgi:hypothetical protein
VVPHRVRWGWLLLAALCAGSAAAQVSTAASAELQSMAGHAAVVFTGQVVDIARNDPAGFVDIRFHIERSIRGAPKSGSYVLREWAGLWIGNPDRYHVGERRLMLLPARGPAGMSCPIGGTDGAIPLIATAAAPSPNSVDAASATAALAVDLRWIQARAQRSGTVEASPRYRRRKAGQAGGRSVGADRSPGVGGRPAHSLRGSKRCALLSWSPSRCFWAGRTSPVPEARAS